MVGGNGYTEGSQRASVTEKTCDFTGFQTVVQGGMMAASGCNGWKPIFPTQTTQEPNTRTLPTAYPVRTDSANLAGMAGPSLSEGTESRISEERAGSVVFWR